jgi:hypothetical protein
MGTMAAQNWRDAAAWVVIEPLWQSRSARTRQAGYRPTPSASASA